MTAKRVRWLILGLLVWAVCGGAALHAEEAAKAAAPAEKNFVGEIIDPAAYLKDGRHGVEATDQTYSAVDGGQTLAFLENGTGDVYLLLAEETGEDPNELAYDYVNQQVKVTGRVYEKGGLRGLAPTAIDPVAAATTPASDESN